MDTVRQDVQLIATHYIARLSFVELGGPRVPLSNISAGLTNLAIICGLVLFAAPWQTRHAAAGSVTGHISCGGGSGGIFIVIDVEKHAGTVDGVRSPFDAHPQQDDKNASRVS